MNFVVRPGTEYRGPYPFLLQKMQRWDQTKGQFGEMVDYVGWRPGCRFETVSGEYTEEQVADCDGEGEIMLSVVSIHRPSKKYPERVFFTRQWRAPDGLIFGKTKLRVLTKAAFVRRCKGWFATPYDRGDWQTLKAKLQIEIDCLEGDGL